MSSVDGVNVGAVEQGLERLLRQDGRAIALDDPVSGQRLTVRPDTAAARDGLLPAYLVAAESVWRLATGKSFNLTIAPDPVALLGYRVAGIGAGTYATVMLSTLEATSQTIGPEALHVNRLIEVWTQATRQPTLSASQAIASGVQRDTAPVRQTASAAP